MAKSKLYAMVVILIHTLILWTQKTIEVIPHSNPQNVLEEKVKPLFYASSVFNFDNIQAIRNHYSLRLQRLYVQNSEYNLLSTRSQEPTVDISSEVDKQIYDNDKFELQQDLKTARNLIQKRRLQIWLLSGFIMVLLIFTVIFYILSRYRRKSIEAQQDLLKKEKDIAELNLRTRDLEREKLSNIIFAEKQISQLQQEKLEQARDKLQAVSFQIIKKNKQFIELKEILDDRLLDSPLPESKCNRLLNILKININESNGWHEFEHDFRLSYPGFLERLEDRFKNLNSNEIQLIAYIRSDLKPREIADIKGISQESVKKSKSRLRKKLQLDPSLDLSDFLQTI